jgi:hypothetical protein
MPHVETTGRELRNYLDADSAPGRSVALPLLLPGTLLTVQTRNTLYRMVVTNGPARQVSITGGSLFPQNSDVEIVGATDREDDVKGGWIVEGLHLELLTERGPVCTSIVESVTVDVDAASVSDDETIQ